MTVKKKHMRGVALGAVVLSMGVLVETAEAETFKLTSLEWPPYSGENLPNSGTSVAVAKAAFAAMGHTLEVEFLPWKRAVQTGLEDPGYSGYFPEYYSASLESDCAFSDRMGSGPLGLVEATANPVRWTNIQDLSAYTIGTVSGYVNTEEFDALAADGTIQIQAVDNDTINLRKVAAGRIDAAVIDQNVMNHLLSTDSRLAADADKLQFNARLLEDKGLYVCFRNTEEGRAAKAIFDQGLGQIDLSALINP